jgi:hypothetical protein
VSTSSFFKGLLKGQNTAAYMTTSTHPHLASELVGLITRKDIATPNTSQKNKNSFSRMLSPHIIAVLQKWALVTKEKMAYIPP